MSGLLELAVMVFLTGLLSFAYGEKVQNSRISNLMGLLTIVAVVTLVAIILFAALPL